MIAFLPLFRHPQILLRRVATAFGFMMFTTLSFASYAEVAVVVHVSNTSSFDKKTISRIYLGKARTFENGETAIPISQNEKSNITAEFNKNALNKSSSQLKAYWSKLVFTGKGTPPRAVENDQQVIELVSNNPNIIGFVSVGSLNGTVKVIATYKD